MCFFSLDFWWHRKIENYLLLCVTLDLRQFKSLKTKHSSCFYGCIAFSVFGVSCNLSFLEVKLRYDCTEKAGRDPVIFLTFIRDQVTEGQWIQELICTVTFHVLPFDFCIKQKSWSLAGSGGTMQNTFLGWSPEAFQAPEAWAAALVWKCEKGM